MEDTIQDFTKQDASQNGSNQIRINAIFTGQLADPDLAPDLRSLMGNGGKGKSLGGRLGVLDEIVDLVGFLLSEKGSFVHGSVFGGK